MGFFTSAEEMYEHVGKLFEIVVNEEQVVRATADTGLVVRLTQTDPDAVILIDFPGRKVTCGEATAGIPARVELTLTSDDSHRFWLGKLNLTLALAQRKVQLGGSRTKALKLLPLTRSMSARYREMLLAAGRQDLSDI
jgi:putative sterol carrier protein